MADTGKKYLLEQLLESREDAKHVVVSLWATMTDLRNLVDVAVTHSKMLSADDIGAVVAVLKYRLAKKRAVSSEFGHANPALLGEITRLEGLIHTLNSRLMLASMKEG